MKIKFENGTHYRGVGILMIIAKPSGTEPQLKTYISVSTDYKEEAEKLECKYNSGIISKKEYNEIRSIVSVAVDC